MVVAEVTEGSAVSTYIASQAHNSSTGTGTCTFTAQLLTTGSLPRIIADCDDQGSEQATEQEMTLRRLEGSG